MWTSESMTELKSIICTLLIHPVEPQLARFIGPTAVHQAREREEQSVHRSGWNLGHRYAGQGGHQDRCILQWRLLPQAQLTVTVQTPREDVSSWKVENNGALHDQTIYSITPLSTREPVVKYYVFHLILVCLHTQQTDAKRKVASCEMNCNFYINTERRHQCVHCLTFSQRQGVGVSTSNLNHWYWQWYGHPTAGWWDNNRIKHEKRCKKLTFSDKYVVYLYVPRAEILPWSVIAL